MGQNSQLTIRKLIVLSLAVVFLASCGFKSIVIPHVDWGLTKRLAEQMALNSDQKKALRKDVNIFLQSQKPLANEVLEKMRAFEPDNIDVRYWQSQMDKIYFEALKDFLPMYGHHLAKLELRQLPKLKKQFKKTNKEIAKDLKKEDLDGLEENFESSLGKLYKDQKLVLKNYDDYFYNTQSLKKKLPS